MSAAVSLCMIVRNEAELLPRFFAAAAGLWDELVVVDTGSTDATPEIADAAGARVIRHRWRDDFAEARNVGLTAATGRFILFLDADEMAPPELVAALRGVVASESIGAATVVMRNEFPNGHIRTTPLLRLFRRDEAIRFRHRIHEEVATDVRAYLERTGLGLAAIPVEVLHLGYTRERALARGKRERDLRLLEACVADDPADFYSWFKMFELFRFWGEVGSAKHQARACLGELARSGPRTLDRAPYGGELITLAVAAFAGDDLRTAARLMDLWAPSLLPSAAFSLRRAEIAEQLGDQERARQGFSRCLGLRDVGGDPQLVLVRPLMGLARLALGAGDLGDAWRLTQEALAGNASDPEALLAASVISRARGAPLVGHEGRKTVVVRDDDTPVLRAVG